MKKRIAGFWVWVLWAGALAADPNAGPDMSSPDKTWAVLCAALKAEDLPGFRACFYNANDESRRFMSAFSELTVTQFRLAKASDLIIAPEGKVLRDQLMGVYTQLVASGQNRKIEIMDDAASWTRIDPKAAGGAEDVLYFKKFNGQWLIDTNLSYSLDTSAGRKRADEFVASAGEQVTILKKVIADIEANKIRSLDELKKRLAEGAGK